MRAFGDGMLYTMHSIIFNRTEPFTVGVFNASYKFIGLVGKGNKQMRIRKAASMFYLDLHRMQPIELVFIEWVVLKWG